MSAQPSDAAAAPVDPRPLRIWPALLLLGLVGAAKASTYLAQELSFGLFMFSVNAPLVAGVGLLLWWTVASRATARERWLGPLEVILIAAAAYVFLDPSIKGMGFLFFVMPTGVAAVGLTLVCLSRTSPAIRLWGALLAAVIGFASWDLARNDGIWGDFQTSLHWRWEPTAEEVFLAGLEHNTETGSQAAEDAISTEQIERGAWPEFRGPQRDGHVPGIVLDTDWQAHPPKELWRRKVGPGWSSFAAAGRSIFTQEQRGNVEVVACYDADTGEPRWIHESSARFWESVAGAGPRATPTLHGGQLFAVGATGLVHCLDPATGAEIWHRDLAQDAGRQPLTWGFASSPLIVDDLVIVYAGGPDDKGVFAYDIQSGEPRWSVAAGDHSYSSPQRAKVAGQDVVLMLTNTGISAIDPATGKNTWNYEWKYEGYRTLQPLVVGDSGILIGTGMGTGTRRVDVALAESGPEFKERWTSLEMKPDFNDYVAHKGCLYGFDHNIFACIDLETGKRNWKKGRYGNGQALLLPDADQLLILTETGEVVVLRANAKNLEELARIKLLSDKTWNHPILVNGRLYVRNAQEAVCVELPLLTANAVAATQD
ncbi:MAG TPA: PQQ-binding-like beta-propeller repeat protein [Pirellulales bacterium]|nr:PQQ-binding-like beta-propeller repeat protein [Pirellulales bacterium]